MALLTRRLHPLRADHLPRLPDDCRACLFWELGGSCPTPTRPAEPDREALTRKAAWVRDRELATGAPGQVVIAEGRTVGWCLFATDGDIAPREPALRRVSDDVLVLATVWVEPDFRGAGLGRLLVRAAVKEVIKRDLDALEAYGDRRHRDGRCLLPATWLVHEGFQLHRDHPRYPLFRMDVKSIASWVEPLETAFEQALAGLKGRPELAPQSFGVRVGDDAPPGVRRHWHEESSAGIRG